METYEYDAAALPAYGDIRAFEVWGDCCEPDIRNGDVALTSADALGDMATGGYVVYTHILNGERYVAKVTAYDGVYWGIENRHGMKAHCMGDFMLGAVVGVIRDGETIPL